MARIFCWCAKVKESRLLFIFLIDYEAKTPELVWNIIFYFWFIWILTRSKVIKWICFTEEVFSWRNIVFNRILHKIKHRILFHLDWRRAFLYFWWLLNFIFLRYLRWSLHLNWIVYKWALFFLYFNINANFESFFAQLEQILKLFISSSIGSTKRIIVVEGITTIFTLLITNREIT